MHIKPPKRCTNRLKQTQAYTVNVSSSYFTLRISLQTERVMRTITSETWASGGKEKREWETGGEGARESAAR